ncbi:MAG: SET domain-containing protein-lysine N-methyltransferase [Chloroflexota bacterium]
MPAETFSYTSPKLEARPHPEKGGMGLFARQPIAKDELLILWGGKVVTLDELPEDHGKLLQIDEGLYLLTVTPEEADYVNHSCDPNAGFLGQVGLVAMRTIAPGEEVTMDYALCDGSPYDEFDCACGAASCRGRVTGDDWRNSELWTRYTGYFSPYLQHRINSQKADSR